MSKLKWTSEHDKNYKALFNKLFETNPKLNIDNYLMKINKRELIKTINNLQLSDSRKESYLFMCARYLAIHKTKDNFIKEFQQQGYDKKIKRRQRRGK